MIVLARPLQSNFQVPTTPPYETELEMLSLFALQKQVDTSRLVLETGDHQLLKLHLKITSTFYSR